MIGKIVKGLVYLVVAVVLLVAGVFVAARFHDGPLGPIPGGPLMAGELVAQPPADWSFAAVPPEVEVQLAYEKTSRTTWIFVSDGVAYIPASLSQPPGKRWHKAADQNGEAFLRIDGKRYPVTLKRVQDEALETKLKQAIVQKYPQAAGMGGGGTWFFKIEPRPAVG
jgi:hypothetical protein